MANAYFDAAWYLQQNPDVAAAGYTEATAWEHYEQFGAAEAYSAGGTVRAPNPWFNVQYYLSANPDLMTAGYTPATALDHFTNYGMYEFRAPNPVIGESPMTVAKLFLYIDANDDLASAFNIVDTQAMSPAQMHLIVEHYYRFGYAEDRPEDPTGDGGGSDGRTYTLTTDVDTFIGTPNDDTFRGRVDAAGDSATINTFDSINGGDGQDTLVIAGPGGQMEAGAEFSSIEVVNVLTSSAVTTSPGGAWLESAAFGDSVQEIWQVGNYEAASVRAANGVTVGYSGVEVTGVTQFAGSSGRVELAGIQSSSLLAIAGSSLSTLTISGNITESDESDGFGDSYLFLDVGNKAGGTSVEPVLGNAPNLSTLNLSFTSEVSLWVLGTNIGNLKTVNASGSTGDVELSLFDPNCGCDDSSLDSLALTSLSMGRGNDVVMLDYSLLSAATVSVSMAAGNDALVLNAGGGDTATALSVTLGSGRNALSMLVEDEGNLVAASSTADLQASLITIADFSSTQDVFDAVFDGRAELRADQTDVDDAVDGAADLFEAASAAAAVVRTAGDDYALFAFGSATYLFVDTADDASPATDIDIGDTLIRLSGVSVEDLVEGENFFIS